MPFYWIEIHLFATPALAHHYKSRSEVIAKALKLLQQVQLEGLYSEANNELEDDFDSVAGDGLENELVTSLTLMDKKTAIMRMCINEEVL